MCVVCAVCVWCVWGVCGVYGVCVVCVYSICGVCVCVYTSGIIPQGLSILFFKTVSVIGLNPPTMLGWLGL